MRVCPRCTELRPVVEFYAQTGKQSRRAYCRACTNAAYRDYNRQYHRRLRSAAIEFLGGLCVGCGFSDARALQIDHVHGGGNVERRKMSNSYSRKICQKVLAGAPSYQLLCANCNWIKRDVEGEI